MSSKIKLSGKKIELPNNGPDWKFTPRPGGWWIAERTLEDGTFQKSKIACLTQGNQVWFHGRGRSYAGEWVTQERHSQNTSTAGEDSFTSQFPGKVRKIIVKDGEKVKSGQTLLLLEAMKMEFAIKAPQDGVVKKILVQPQQQVLPGMVLLDFEGSKK